MLITFDKKTHDNFYGHIWNNHLLFENILQFVENRRWEMISTQQPVHPDNKKKWGFKKVDYQFSIETQICSPEQYPKRESIGPNGSAFALSLRGKIEIWQKKTYAPPLVKFG